MAKPRFGLDLDGVCYQWTRTAMYMWRAYRGYTRSQLPDESVWTSWDWQKTVVSRADEDWLWRDGVKLGLFRYGHAYPGTVKALNELSELVDIVVITHRPKNAVQDTLDWLAYNRIPASEVHVLSSSQPKSDIKCDLYLDDKTENALDFSKNTSGLPLLWTRPWNEKDEVYDGIYRVTSWDRVIEAVNWYINIPTQTEVCYEEAR